jgi:heme oxygenase (mycobilin-producing)
LSFVAINALTVPPEMRDALEKRFAARAGEVDGMDGFEAFELLRPLSGQDLYLVYTRWRDEESFKAWTESQEFSRGHAQHSSKGPAASHSDVWTFAVAERSESKAS